VHTGFWGVNRYHPIHMMPLIECHPEVHFDLFHAGVPYVRELGLIAVNFPNTSVNLCWAHSINAAMAAGALEEYIDQLGMDKIIAFGGDVRWMVEKVYGHLELARQNIADVLARRIERGLMNLEDTTRIAKLWFFDNPVRIYRLPVPLD
jgi:predicted TIM-barrel fold metal-dependent hydrolase